MLDIGKDTGPVPKCLFSHILLPQTIDDKQPPTKKKPFSSILDSPFHHTVDFLVTDPDHANFAEKLRKTIGGQRYARVYLKLKDLIEGEFFNQYIKTGNILLLSEGISGVDNLYSLHDGILHLELDKPTYERAGLVGQPIATPGRKHSKARYAIDLNLRLPSMVRGRPLFNRIVYAFTHALTETKTWLFYDFNDASLDLSARPAKRQKVSGPLKPSEPAQATKDTGSVAAPDLPDMTTYPNKIDGDDKFETPSPSEEGPQPLEAHHPLLFPIEPDLLCLPHTLVPSFPTTLSPDDQPEAAELLECLSLAMLPSPRLQQGDKCDSTLSRYSVPDLTSYLAPPKPSNNDSRESGGETRSPSHRVIPDVQDHDPSSPRAEDKDGDIPMDSGPSSPPVPPSILPQPDTSAKASSTLSLQPPPTPQSLTLQKIHYHAFLPSPLVNKMLITLINFAQKEKTWAALRVQGFGGKKVMILLAGEAKGAMVWEY
ncbi:ribonuclease P 40kDa subunit-domain-containing protein [Elsinoe ampelina]|uniref:Ribonuclease P 40kDa subunit-domain-containing protein n=1 Tax=Elsinoe ampelina TaxID=302913 RepID=A0A6A6GBK3_9PEZI|nr:ribonuclease P 40kDa subunit-domain-containing protein [Elsinoe ampelina]